MTKSFSIYLDLVRFTAACLVYLYHSNQRALVADILPASNYGHSSVIVFFVLSGYVIAYVTATKESTWRAYIAARITRVYSVALPAVVITVVLDTIGRGLYPQLYGYPYDQFGVRITSSLAFLNEVWFVSITSFSNVPYWSICYEVWYYVMFAAWMFMPRRLAVAGLLCMACLLGPKILLLAPIWLLGVWLYRSEGRRALAPRYAWPMLLASVCGVVVFHWLDVPGICTAWLKSVIGENATTQLTFSKFFISDYPLGLLVAMNFVAMRSLSGVFASLFEKIEGPVRFCASYTFTLYLLHQPLFLFWAAVWRGDPSGYGFWLLVTLSVALSVIAIGYVTEHKRHVFKREVVRIMTTIVPPLDRVRP